jgi:hypothetical protein
LRNQQEELFNKINSEEKNHFNPDFSKIKLGLQTLNDATLSFGNLSKINPRANKRDVLEAIKNSDYTLMREISNYFFKTSGIYSRLCRYLAYLYRFDWMITPHVLNKNRTDGDKLLNEFNKALNFLDKFGVKKYFGEVSLKVIRNGCYYGYIIPHDDTVSIQELPPDYCRSNFSINNRPVVQFNMSFFDEKFRNSTQKVKILKLFPKEFKKGYELYKKGKLPIEFPGDTSGWYTLDPEYAFKFNINGEDFPFLISVIPAIIDLDEAQGLDRMLMQQKLLKLIIQKLPLDKNGDPIFDMEEAGAIHNNAVRMLKKAIGVDVLTSFADVEVKSMESDTSTSATDDLERMERAIYNQAGVSEMQFNTDGNIALEKSILNDEASLYNLICQYEIFLNYLLEKFFNTKKISFRAQILTTTIYNYKDMAKLYKEQTQLGYSKFLPQIALGQSQSSILANAYFENDILDLVNLFIPPLMSSTMNGDFLTNRNANNDNDNVGRPEKPDDEKSTKTLQNEEAKS